MSIIISDLAYHYPNQDHLFAHISFSVEKQSKISIVGNNGVGKSTILKLLAGELSPSEGSITSSSQPYYIPQHTGLLHQTVAEVLQISDKLKAMEAIIQGSVSQADYDTLADDWTIESRYESALAYWQLSHIKPDTPIDDLSGGEKTKVFLSGLLIHTPEFILLDEPSNHLDAASRELLYQYIEQSTASIVVVSHDRVLLDQLDTTYELSEQGIKLYGGNYSFYIEQKEIEENALDDSIHAEEKALRLARKKAQEVRERQEKRLSKGQKNKSEVPRIAKKTLTNSSENTAARLKDKHGEIINNSQSKLTDLRQQKRALKELKIDFENASLHAGKLLIEATGINYAYQEEAPLWKNPLDFKLYSNDRIHICGNNGSGKTTFIKLLTGLLSPSAGEIKRADFKWIYLDQNYSRVDTDCSIEELAESYNHNNLPEHEVKLRLNRFLFPSSTWDKNCRSLSGGEKMRLYLCCLMISNQTPDLIILDEPTNNLDIANMQILTQTIKNYRGSLLVISHDRYFVNEIGTTSEIEIG
ncbi:ribosomal protection-like ABC-F family protein [Bacteroides sp. 51]|uniref:ribosomal protection-like ABC-F family protein n=1 Tax=Bacteroides sp. 51 TaxID=2302938 RepID=UPI0013D214BF|nr:ABC-F family ATP-binding cassette domain-containing protein [Bacteroides sp. 51]NDV84045.1 ABC transporter ATP-binding protein [Bacteroides sp. 51]